MQGETAADRTVIGLAGADVIHFLHGLVSNEVRPLAKGPGIVWAALLTPQGKYLADFFVVSTGDRYLIDVKSDLAPGLLKRLTLYRLRADVATLGDDRYMAPDLQAAAALAAEGALVTATGLVPPVLA